VDSGICSNLSWSGRSYAIVENMIVDRVFRGQGVGKEILHHATEKARHLNCYKIALMTGSKRKEVLDFYRAAGSSKDKVGFQIRF
jgi:GNAT superfamily N-acetyltransferase